ncbi:MAG: hypothetical protein ABJB03_06125 [Rhodoglobus sp.]
MVDLRGARRLHAIGERAITEAVSRGAAFVEAEHVLLAILEGASHDRFAAALELERARSLAVVGITAADRLDATPRRGKPGWGASVRDLMKAEKPATTVELATAILRAELGTVPRALAIARIEPAELVSAVRRTAPDATTA